MKIFVVLPAYDEAARIAVLVGRIHGAAGLQQDLRVVVVDDGSTDGTAQEARRAGASEVIRFPRNRGVGEALGAGLRRVCEQGGDDDLCFTMDADDTHDPSLMCTMAHRLQSGADVVVASRFRPGGGMRGCPPWRRLLSMGLSRLMRLACPGRITDFSTFYRGYRVSLLRRVLDAGCGRVLRGRGFESYTGFLLAAASMTDRIEEVPAVLEYGRKAGASKMRMARTIAGQAGLVARTAFSRPVRTGWGPR